MLGECFMLGEYFVETTIRSVPSLDTLYGSLLAANSDSCYCHLLQHRIQLNTGIGAQYDFRSENVHQNILTTIAASLYTERTAVCALAYHRLTPSTHQQVSAANSSWYDHVMLRQLARQSLVLSESPGPLVRSPVSQSDVAPADVMRKHGQA
jgi:hypothetical protein